MAAGPPRVLCAGSMPTTEFVDFVSAAAGAGFDGISCWERTHRRVVERHGRSVAWMRAVLDDHGLHIADYEAIELGSLDEQPLDVAAELGAGVVVAICGEGAAPSRSELVDRFGRWSAAAADRGLRLALEAPPFTHVGTTGEAYAVVEETAHPSGGVLLDTWHHRRGGSSDELLERLPVERVFGVQLADGPIDGETDLLDEAMWRRQAPGEGALDVAGMLRPLLTRGLECAIGVEVYESGRDDGDARTTAHRLAAAVDATLAAAR